jgi:hypothetical protein
VSAHPGGQDTQADIGATATVKRSHPLDEMVTAVARGRAARTGWSSTCQPSRLSGRARRGTDGRCCLPVDGQDLVVLLALEASSPPDERLEAGDPGKGYVTRHLGGA